MAGSSPKLRGPGDKTLVVRPSNLRHVPSIRAKTAPTFPDSPPTSFTDSRSHTPAGSKCGGARDGWGPPVFTAPRFENGSESARTKKNRGEKLQRGSTHTHPSSSLSRLSRRLPPSSRSASTAHRREQRPRGARKREPRSFSKRPSCRRVRSKRDDDGETPSPLPIRILYGRASEPAISGRRSRSHALPIARVCGLAGVGRSGGGFGARGRIEMENLLDTEIGKHDYDWLLTPPGTPRVPVPEVAERAPTTNVPKRTTTRSSSTSRASRLSISEAENGHSMVPTGPMRSNSRPSIQSVLMSSNNRSSVLNTSISSVSSRPTTPSKRTSTPMLSKPSVPASRPVAARSSTPVKPRPSTPLKTRPSTPVKSSPSVFNSIVNSTAVKTTSAQNSRSSTPTSRSRIISSSSSSTGPAIGRTSSSSSTGASVSRSSSRSSTPTCQPVMRSSAPPIARSPSVGRISGSNNLTSSGRSLASRGRISAPSSAPSSRPSSPNPHTRAPVRLLDIPDFPSDTPPNLRTKLPERPLSAGRARPGIGLVGRSTLNAEPVSSAPVKKMSVPAITRSKFSDASSKAPSLTSGHQNRRAERSVMDGQPARPSQSATSAENGFGRTISRKSLDMAIRHMDIRQNLGGIRGASLFPHSIRSSAPKGRPARRSDPGHHISNGDHGTYIDNGSINGHFSGDSNGALSHYGGSSTDSPDRESIGTKETLSELDMYGSSRYEEMLLREDTKNTDWLHSVDDKSDQSPVFDHRFEPLPEPFGPL